MLNFCHYAWWRGIKMGISSLNIGIKIKFDFPFLCHHFDDIVQI